jgi:hypothetical protein
MSIVCLIGGVADSELCFEYLDLFFELFLHTILLPKQFRNGQFRRLLVLLEEVHYELFVVGVVCFAFQVVHEELVLLTVLFHYVFEFLVKRVHYLSHTFNLVC